MEEGIQNRHVGEDRTGAPSRGKTLGRGLLEEFVKPEKCRGVPALEIMTNSRNGTAVQEKVPTQLVIRDAGYNGEQKLKMVAILERQNTLKTTASLRINEVA